VFDERDVRRQAGDALVHILERLEVRQLDHRKERLLERVDDLGDLREELIEVLLELLRNGERLVDRSGDRDLDLAKPSTCQGIREQVVGKQGVQVADRVAIEPDLLDVVDEHLDRSLVVEDHLGFALLLAGCVPAELDEVPGIEPCIGVALEAARCPR